MSGGRSTCHPELCGDHHMAAKLFQGTIVTAKTGKQGQMFKVRRGLFWVSEAYELSGRGQGAIGSTGKQEGNRDKR